MSGDDYSLSNAAMLITTLVGTDLALGTLKPSRDISILPRRSGNGSSTA